MRSKLRLIGGCLKLETKDGIRTALWQASDALDLSDPTRVAVLDRLTGTRVTAGEEIVLTGPAAGRGARSQADRRHQKLPWSFPGRARLRVWATCPTTESCRSVEKAIASIRGF